MRNRNVVIDFARLLFCFGIIFLHMNPIRIESESELIMCFGYLGVEFFFIVSGWLMANKADRIEVNSIDIGNATLRFLWKKFSNIFPYYIVAAIASFVILHWPDMFFTRTMARDLLLSVPYIMQLELAGFQTYEIFSPAWFLSALFLSMFILFPLCLRFKSSFGKIVAPNIAIWCYGYLIYTVGALSTIEPLEGTYLHTGMLRGLAGISLGCCCYYATKALQTSLVRVKPSVPLTVIEVGCYLLAFLSMRTSDLFRPDFIFLLLVSIAITIFFSNLSYTSFLSKSKVMSILGGYAGKLSMCLYLTNMPAQNLTCILLPIERNISRLGLYLVINIIFGLVLMIVIDVVSRIFKNIKSRKKSVIC